jgi:uncharacterized protein (DUF488 family)
MKRLMTVGYEKTALDDFVAALKEAQVTTLLDVREIPVSRRRGFSKSALREAVTAVGIDYRHERQLGSPREIRHRLHADGDYASYFAEFGKYLQSQQALLERLADELSGAVALMCFERDPTTCHRSAVARHLEHLTGLTVRHLEVTSGSGSKGTRAYSGQGISAA